MNLECEPSSEPLHIFAKYLSLNCELYMQVQGFPLTPQPEVRLMDRYGNGVTVDAGFTVISDRYGPEKLNSESRIRKPEPRTPRQSGVQQVLLDGRDGHGGGNFFFFVTLEPRVE